MYADGMQMVCKRTRIAVQFQVYFEPFLDQSHLNE